MNSTQKPNFISGNKVYLRPIEEEDLQMIYVGKNSEKIVHALHLFKPLTFAQVKEEIISMCNNKETTLFTICSVENDVPLGITAFVRIDWVSRAAVFFIALFNSDIWSKGFGSEATSLMVKFAFDTLNLNRIQLHVSNENPNAIKAYTKAGFQLEGTLREAMYYDNRYIDFSVMGLLRNDYYKNS